MDTFFELVFDEVALSDGEEVQVKCPFPHITNDGEIYYEERPSASINLSKGVYHCHSCKKGLNEIGFIAEYMDLSYNDANKLKQILSRTRDDDDVLSWKEINEAELFRKEKWLKVVHDLGISNETIEEIHLGYSGKEGIDFPLFLFGKRVDTATYRPNQTPKIFRSKGSKSGLINPYDLWREETKKATVICAGEKDMAIAREHGLNAITITGGEGALPKLFKNDFKDRTVYIIYDNDPAGKNGANRLAVFLKDVVKRIKVIDLSDTCKEKGEDLWDFFMKYNKDKKDLKTLIRETPEFNNEKYETEKEKVFPTLALIDASKPKYAGKIVRSNVQVISVFETQFSLPSAIKAKKTHINEEGTPAKNKLKAGEERHWYLGEENLKDLLYLVDSRLKEKDIYKHKLEFMHIGHNEENIQIQDEAKETAYKCSITDVLDPEHDKQRVEIMAYSLNKKLENGKKYKVTYKLVPHPFDGQKLVMIILDLEDVNDAINNFELTQDKIEHLRRFQVETTLEEKLADNVERIKGMTNINHNEKLALIIDLWYHSVLKFNVGRFKDIKGALDVLLVGESRTGKSEITNTLHNKYKVGQIVSLPSATEPAIVGGSSMVQGSYQTRAGIIPMNHGGAIALEELGKSRDTNILKKLTEIKSSGITRISRVNGTVELPSLVRMLSITNTRTHGGTPKPITSYPNGIEIVTDLVGAAEDIARFDMIAVFAFKADNPMEAFPEFKEPHPQEAYRTRITWVWSRNQEQIQVSKDVFQYLVDTSNDLKKEFNSHIKIFGTEAWKKILRLAIAIAGYVVSTDASFENIIVKKEHIKYAAEFMRDLYDNDIFAFKQYIEEERMYREIDPQGVKDLQILYDKSPTLVQHLESISKTSRNNLQAVSGLDGPDFTVTIKNLAKGNFIQFHNYDIHPTERFRKGAKKLKRDTSMKQMGSIMMGDDENEVV